MRGCYILLLVVGGAIALLLKPLFWIMLPVTIFIGAVISLLRRPTRWIIQNGYALTFASIGIFLIIVGFSFVHGEPGTFAPLAFIRDFVTLETFTAFVDDLYANAGSELISIAITVIFIDGLNRRRAEASQKEELIFQMGADEIIITKQAIRYLRYKKWLQDGSLANKQLNEANLQGANLREANLEKVNLYGAILQEANLYMSNLQGANLRGAQLQDANLSYAKLEGAYLVGAELQNAKMQHARLQGATLTNARLHWTDLQKTEFDESTKLPDHTDDNPICWTPRTDMGRYTNPDHPNFWQPDWVATGFSSWRDWDIAGRPSPL